MLESLVAKPAPPSDELGDRIAWETRLTRISELVGVTFAGPARIVTRCTM